MIRDAEEFVRLRLSEAPEEYLRAATESADLSVWQGVIAKFPEMKRWVVHNKTIPIEILHLLSEDPAPEVRAAIAMKNKLPSELMTTLARDRDEGVDRKSTRLNSSHSSISYAVFCLKKKK